MRSLSLVILSIGCAMSLSSCGLVAHQVKNVQNLLTAPFKAELDVRFIDGIPEMERPHRLSMFS
ncbi:MAG: hypothetical protein P1U68_11885 [Verrucomicrobiales bacterium]|nr:hypothetical protein [Verrucomicrobiales bacterium]